MTVVGPLGICQAPFQRWVFAKWMSVPEDQVQLPSRITDFAAPECAVVNGSPAEVVAPIGVLADLAPIDRLTYQADSCGQPWPHVLRSLELCGGVLDDRWSGGSAPAARWW